MLELYFNYSVNSGPTQKRVQVVPYNNVAAATRQRATLEMSAGISHCWVGISRDETRQLLAVEGSKVMQFVPAAIPTAA